VRLVLLAALGLAVYLVVRRRGTDSHRVVVAWTDGSELELPPGAPERDRLLDSAGRVLR
jgi:hypothetical protein